MSVCTFWILPSLCQDAACKALMVDRVWNDGFYWHPKTLQTNLESILPFPSTGFTCIQELFTDQNIRLQGLDGLWGVKWQILLALHPEAVRDIWLILLLFKTHEGNLWYYMGNEQQTYSIYLRSLTQWILKQEKVTLCHLLVVFLSWSYLAITERLLQNLPNWP